jgi:hypothetical protein
VGIFCQENDRKFVDVLVIKAWVTRASLGQGQPVGGEEFLYM